MATSVGKHLGTCQPITCGAEVTQTVREKTVVDMDRLAGDPFGRG